MNATRTNTDGDQTDRCITLADTVRWYVDEQSINGRSFDISRTYLLDGLSPVPDSASISGAEKRFVSRMLERIGAILLVLVERLIYANVLAVSGDHGLGDQVALEARVRFSDEEFERREQAGGRCRTQQRPRAELQDVAR